MANSFENIALIRKLHYQFHPKDINSKDFKQKVGRNSLRPYN
jgi:hypothetical protein